jgi:formylglycine-generating enzyme required for sulfatase activity
MSVIQNSPVISLQRSIKELWNGTRSGTKIKHSPHKTYHKAIGTQKLTTIKNQTMISNLIKCTALASIFLLASLQLLVASPSAENNQGELNRLNLLTYLQQTQTYINLQSLTKHQQLALTQLEKSIQSQDDPLAHNLLAALSNGLLPKLSNEWSQAYHQFELTEGATLNKNQLLEIVTNPRKNVAIILSEFSYNTGTHFTYLNVQTLQKTLSKPILSTITDHGAVTVFPSANAQQLSAGYYDSINISGSTNLIASNLGAGNTVFDVAGSYTGYGASITDATVTANTLLVGTSLYNAAGIQVTGTIPNNGTSTLTPSATTQTATQGYYDSITVAGNASLTPANIRSGVNIWSVTGDGNVIDTGSGSASSSDLSTGKTAYVQGVLVTGNISISSLSSTATTVNAGIYSATDLASVDTDLTSTNLKSGSNLFGVQGSSTVVDTSSATALATAILSGKTAFVKGLQLTGTLASQSLSNTSTALPAGAYTATTLNTVDTDLSALNIASGVNIFGIVGTFTTNTSSGNASAQHILTGLTAWVNASQITGVLANQVLSSANAILSGGNYSSGNLISIDGDLIASNLASGVNIFGILGTASIVNTISATATASDILNGKIGFVQGAGVTGNISVQTLSNTSMAAGYYNATNLTTIDVDLVTANLKSGANIYGILGSSTVVETSSANATASDILNSKIGFVAGTQITGSIASLTFSANTPVFTAGNSTTTNLQSFEADLIATKISTGTNIFGILGTASNTSSGNANAASIIAGYKAWVSGSEITGTLPNQTLSATTVLFSAGNYSGNLALVDSDLITANLASGTNIFGVQGNSTLVDTSNATATAAGIASGKTAFAQGSQITGTLASKALSSSSTTMNAGVYSATNLTTVAANLVSANIISGGNIFGVLGNSNVVNTASANATTGDILNGRTGYVSSSQVTGSIADLAFSSNTYLFSAGNYSATYLTTIEANLLVTNIASGVNIFGVVGNNIGVDSSSANILASQVLAGQKVWVGGSEVTGTLASQVLSSTTHVFSAGNYSNTTLATIDTDLSVNKLVYGANVFGVMGTNSTIVNTVSGNAMATDIFTGYKGWVDGVELTGTGVILDAPATVASNTQVATGSANFQYMIDLNYCIIDISGGSTVNNYPVTFTDVRPDFTGAGNFEYKTNKIVLKWIPAGVFTMGNTGVADAVHQVTLTKGFFAGVFQTTQKQWLNVMGNLSVQDYNNSGNTMPVHRVSWQDIRGASGTYDWPTVTTIGQNTFMGNLRAKTGLKFDLPTEAEWEYTCRAGTITKWSYGSTMDGAYHWDSSNSSSTAHEVGGKSPNPWGLYDIHYNVWDLCLDWYTAGYSPAGDQINPGGNISGPFRIMRGGSFSDGSNVTSAYRSANAAGYRSNNMGFRLFLRPN